MKLIIITLLTALITSQCPNDQKCAACQKTECKMCYQSYLNFGKCITPQNPIEKCLRYQSEKVCDVCFHGYTTNDDGACVKIGIKDCLYLVENQCKLCKRGILVENGLCGEKKCKSEDCAFCTVNSKNEEMCDQCNSGFALKNVNGRMQCAKEGKGEEHCMLLGEVGKCTLCDVNYYNKEGKCVKSKEMDIKMISDQGFVDKMGDKIKNLFGSFVHVFEVLSLGSCLVMIFA